MSRLVKVLDQQFWANDGTAALGTLHASTTMWLTPTQGQSGVVTVTPALGHWQKLSLGGDIDVLRVCYRSKLVAVGGLTNVTVAGIIPVVVAQAEKFGLTATVALINAGGTGYALNDTITLAGGTGTAATLLTVATLSGSAVATVAITRPGQYSIAPDAGAVAQSATSGSGTGATFKMTFAEDADFSQPAASLVTPEQVLKAGRFGTDALSVLFWEGATAQPTAATYDSVPMVGGNIFELLSPTVTADHYGWTFEILPRRSDHTVGNSGAPRTSLYGIQDVYLAIASAGAQAGTLTTTKLKGAIRVFGYREVD